MNKRLIALLYKTAERKQSVGNRADPTVCLTYTWSIPLPRNNKLHVQIQVVWDVELKYTFNSKPWKRISYGHTSRFEQFVQNVWGELEDIYYPKEDYSESYPS